LAKWDYSPLFAALAFRNGLQYRHFDFRKFICDDLATVTPEFKKGNDVHLVDKQFGYAAPLLDLAGISTEFSGAIITQFRFTYTLDGVTAMPRGLHAELCHTFLVDYVMHARSNLTYI